MLQPGTCSVIHTGVGPVKPTQLSNHGTQGTEIVIGATTSTTHYLSYAGCRATASQHTQPAEVPRSTMTSTYTPNNHYPQNQTHRK